MNEDSPAPDEVATDQSGSGWSVKSVSRRVFVVAALGLAIHVLLPQVGELTQGFQALRSGRWPYLLVALAASSLVFVASAWMVRASTPTPPHWGQAVATQVAAGFSSAVTPVGLGWFAVTQASLRRAGASSDEAAAATGLNMAVTVASHIGFLLLLLPFLPALSLPRIQAPAHRIAVDITVVLAVIVGLLAWIPPTRRQLIAPILGALSQVAAIVRDPRRSLTIVAGAVAQNLLYALVLMASLAAFGAKAPPLAVLLVYMLGATVAAIAPTPGGLGAMEAALVAGLTRIGVPGGEAIAAVLAFRMATFWLPLPIGALLLRVSRGKSWV